MKTIQSRRGVIKTLVAGGGLAALSSLPTRIQAAEASLEPGLKGKVNHSACRWCYNDIPLEQLVIAAKEIGLKSIELLNAEEWDVAIKHGLTCAMGYASTIWLDKGANDPTLHEALLKDFTNAIPKAADKGIKNLICFSGNRKGVTDEKGLENCARGLDPIVKLASRYNITVSMELLNSKVDHKDYLCDHTEWGAALCEKLGAENFKLLYDIYHMQIMEGDVIATIRKHAKYISHYHTGGVPGRHEIDETQELNYPAIMKAIVETGFTGFVAQEFIPAKADKIASLRQGVAICDVSG